MMFTNICCTPYTPLISTFFKHFFLTYHHIDSCLTALKRSVVFHVAIWMAAYDTPYVETTKEVCQLQHF